MIDDRKAKPVPSSTRAAIMGEGRAEDEAVATRAVDSRRADALHDDALTLNQAARRFYPVGTAVSTVLRHVLNGIRTPAGIVKLEAHRIGGRWVTTVDAVERFRDACTVRSGGEARASAGAAHARADAYLRSIGL